MRWKAREPEIGRCNVKRGRCKSKKRNVAKPIDGIECRDFVLSGAEQSADYCAGADPCSQ